MSEETHSIRFVPHVSSNSRSLYFEAFEKEFTSSTILKVGRSTDRVQPTPERLAFKSKVFFIKDTKSSSGTFLNHSRLSTPNAESKPFPLKDGDIIQLGVDYQGGTQGSDESSECCICLCSITAFQSLFVAPCSHIYHFKCIKPLVFSDPSFVCPLCRTYADLNADVCTEEPTLETGSLSDSPNNNQNTSENQVNDNNLEPSNITQSLNMETSVNLSHLNVTGATNLNQSSNNSPIPLQSQNSSRYSSPLSNPIDISNDSSSPQHSEVDLNVNTNEVDQYLPLPINVSTLEEGASPFSSSGTSPAYKHRLSDINPGNRSQNALPCSSNQNDNSNTSIQSHDRKKSLSKILGDVLKVFDSRKA